MASSRTLSPRLRWAVPAGVAAAVVAAFTVPSMVASATTDLPDITASELLASVAEAESVPVPVSGTVVYTARLGLPEVPLSEMQGAGPLDLLGGSSTIRLWSDGKDRSRAALLSSTSEYSVVRDGAEAWTYSSHDDEVVHYTVAPEDLAAYEKLEKAARTRSAPEVAGDLPTPTQAADALLAYAKMSTDVSVGTDAQIAGRDAYELVLTPRGDGSLVERVLVAVDAETRTPLRLQVWSTTDSATPALEVGFTDVTFAAPDDAVFDFTAPAGATTREVEVPLPEPSDDAMHGPFPDGALLDDLGPGEGRMGDASEGVSVTGFGWETVVELRGVDVDKLLAGEPASGRTRHEHEPSLASEGARDLYEELMSGAGTKMHDIDVAAILEQVTTEVPEGRLLSSALLSVLVTDDDRVLVGAVPGETLRDLSTRSG